MLEACTRIVACGCAENACPTCGAKYRAQVGCYFRLETPLADLGTNLRQALTQKGRGASPWGALRPPTPARVERRDRAGHAMETKPSARARVAWPASAKRLPNLMSAPGPRPALSGLADRDKTLAPPPPAPPMRPSAARVWGAGCVVPPPLFSWDSGTHVSTLSTSPMAHNWRLTTPSRALHGGLAPREGKPPSHAQRHWLGGP